MSQFSAQTATDYLLEQGFRMKPIHDPMLWTHLEEVISDSSVLGGKFAPATSTRVGEMLSKAEQQSLISMAEQHQRTGSLGVIQHIVSMPFIVGTEGMIPLESVEEIKRLMIVVRPAQVDEHLVPIVLVADDAMPGTNQMTVACGRYADGRTLGVCGMRSGGQAGRRAGGQGAYLATKRDIEAVMMSMTEHMDDLVTVTQAEGKAMLQKLRAALA